MSASQLTAASDACSAHSAGILPGGSVESQLINPAKLAVQEFEQAAALLGDYAQRLDLTQLLAYDLEGRIVVWTSGDEALYGWSKAETAGLKAHALLQTVCAQPLEEINA